MSCQITAVLRVRLPGNGEPESYDFGEAPMGALFSAVPWRTFRWRVGQMHYSGFYWSVTEAGHVIYESRLELARVLYADFNPKVERIVAQPFHMSARIDGAMRRHIPDYLLLTDTGPIVVDVKPAHRLSDEKVAFCFAWSREVVESRGWRYEVWVEPPAAVLENIRFLAGYRRGWLFDPQILAALDQSDLDGVTLAEAFASVPESDERLVRSSVFHQLWTGRLTTDLDTPLSSRHMLRRAS